MWYRVPSLPLDLHMHDNLAKLPPPAGRLATDIGSGAKAALMLFDEIERLAEMPIANEAINAMLERIDLRIGL